ncbi:MAG: sulfate ABC transporter permease subunit CysT [Methylobacter tundripaludum]|uniref:Sulfate transport system permease protein CysT n=1 Tax=Methylobacter tundripaludum TaxID=173365 RepID=A0A2S6GU35_9GAMM|nr:sulfate ABC transporter permease subunit CysT [Methylobacter tundripaludum]MCF7966060.1 sulfate ABC transporter permease subunit CysT [Methylobacter tundripaludum]MCK9634910.1 sulfate ABC transporter permease subunit CysT [Methylobacter tundripaludum]PPK68720.1 sulfate transport system permease protein [Methylobacter tundripaludum]
MPQSNIMPGFRPAIGFTLFYLALIVLIPLSAMLLKTLQLSLNEYWAILTNERVQASFRLSFGAALIAAAAAAIFGFIIAWSLVRYSFPGKRLFDALIDLPFALPTAVAGIVLAAIYEPRGWIGKLVMDSLGIQIAYKPLGIVFALIFIGLPFVVRTIEPVLQELDTAMEEAAASLGATRRQTFVKVILPNILPATITGFALAFARGIGEYGSVIFIAGNMPYISEIVPLLIITKLEQYDYAGATAIGLTMLILSFVLLLLINGLQWWVRRRSGQL